MNRYKTWIATVATILLIGSGMPAQAETGATTIATTETTMDGRIDTEASVAVGYRGTSVHGTPGRAREYDSLKSSPFFNLKLFTDTGSYHLDLGIDYLNEDDYRAEVHLDTQRLLRLDLRGERFFHNLDHIPYDNGYSGAPGTGDRNLTGLPSEGSRPDAFFGADPRVYYTDKNTGDKYGLRLDINEAKVKIKSPDYPAHFNLSYWRYEKQGKKQMRFASEGGAGACVGCHLQSETRDINRVTEEFKVSADAHAGFVDVVLEGLYRTFRDKEDIPVGSFGAHGLGRVEGEYEHDEDPDNTLKEATLRLNTAPSGGLVGSASFTIGERENRSDLTSVGEIDAKTDYTKTSADVTYTPSQHWTFNLRYRLLDLDSDNSDVLSPDPGSVIVSPLPVRNSMDITRAWYEAVVNYRPAPRLTMKAEFRREEIDRSDAGGSALPFYSAFVLTRDETSRDWDLPDEEIITRVKLGFVSRLLEKSALKLNGWLAVQRNDDPAYGTSFEDSQELFFSTSYTPSPVWGFLASFNLLKQESNELFGLNGMVVPGFTHADQKEIAREKHQQNLSLGTWLTPRDGLTFDLNYGYFRTDIDQDLLFGRLVVFGNDFHIEDEDVEYRQSVQTITLGATWQPFDNFNCRLEGYHIRSKASFDPDFPDAATASSSDLREISKIDIRQNGLRGRLNWQIDDDWACAVEASYDKYDERNSSAYDGSVQTCMVSLSRSW